MISLRTLGRPDVRGASDALLAPVRSRPKLLALLSYLVLASADGRHRRDALLALFWPESDDRRARTSLRSALYQLRAALGAATIPATSGDEVAVDLLAIDCDALAVERALAAKQLDEAVARYTGPLLDGLYVIDAPEFDRWLEGRRALLHARVADAANVLADRALATQGAAAARPLAERALALDPLSEQAFGRLAAVTAAAGDRARVMALADEWDRAVREATGEPPPRPGRTIALEALRAPEILPVADGPAVRAPEPAPQATRRTRPRRLLLAAGVIAVLVTGAGGAAFSRYGTRTARAARAVDAAARSGAAAGEGRDSSRSASDPVAAFAEGERMMRAGRIGAAVDAYSRAVALDSAFALASYRLGIAASWNDQGDLGRAAIDASLRHAERLSDDERLLARAQRFYLDAAADSAYALVRVVLARRPEQLEGWLQLGEVAFHYGPLLGIPPDSAERAFARALLLAPNDLSALHHLLRLRARRGPAAELDSLVARLLALGPDARRSLEISAIQAAVNGDEATLGRVVADPLLASDFALTMVPMVATSSLALDAAERLGSRAGSGAIAIPNGGALQVTMLLAQLALARGDRTAFERARRELGRTSPGRGIELEAVRLVLPGAPPSGADVAAVLRLLDAPDASDESIGPSREQVALHGIYPPRRMWLRAMLRARLGDRGGASRLADSLAAWRVGNAINATFAATYARVVRAQLLLDAGQPAAALASLGAPGAQPDRTLPDMMSVPKAHERWLRVVLLRQLGRDAESRGWASGFPDPQGYDLPYLPAVRAVVGADRATAARRR